MRIDSRAVVRSLERTVAIGADGAERRGVVPVSSSNRSVDGRILLTSEPKHRQTQNQQSSVQTTLSHDR